MIPTEADLVPCPYGCGQDVLVTQTERNFRLAVNPDPDPAGNAAVRKDATSTWRSRSLAGADAMEPLAFEHVFMPHIATSKTCKPAPPAATLPGFPAGFARRRTARLPYPRRIR